MQTGTSPQFFIATFITWWWCWEGTGSNMGLEYMLLKVCVYKYFAYMCVCVLHVFLMPKFRRLCQEPLELVVWMAVSQQWVLKLNLGPLQGHPMLFAPEPALQPQICLLWLSRIYCHQPHFYRKQTSPGCLETNSPALPQAFPGAETCAPLPSLVL